MVNWLNGLFSFWWMSFQPLLLYICLQLGPSSDNHLETLELALQLYVMLLEMLNLILALKYRGSVLCRLGNGWHRINESVHLIVLLIIVGTLT